MRQQVWRWANTLTPAQVSAQGAETGTPTISTLYTDLDVNVAINQAVTARFLDMTANGEDLFADEEYIDVVAGLVEYVLPVDLAFLRSLWWKDHNVSADLVQSAPNPPARVFMHKVDDGIPTWYNSAPTYRFYMNIVRLNETPRYDNARGIQVRYIKWAQYMAHDDAVLEMQFAPLVQQLVILDAVAALTSLKGGLVFQHLAEERLKWETRLAYAVRSQLSPPFINISTPAQDTFRYGWNCDGDGLFPWTWSGGFWNG